MPIHLGPISRREFLARSLTAGAILALSPKLLGDSKATDENSWALLSDTHLAANRTLAFRGINMAQHLEQVRTELLALSKRPAGVFINGDCAFDSGQTGDYELLVDLLKPLREDGMPIHLSLGNHDHRERFWAALPREKQAKRPLEDRQTALLPTTHANWFVLDSLETTLQTPGLLGREQLDWLAKSLDEHANKPALVLIHHNPGINGGNMGLKDTLLLLEILRPRKHVKAYIYGHTHHWGVEKDGSGIHFINLPPVGYVFREGEPSGWVHANVSANSMTLELRCVDHTHKAHGQKFSLDWRA
jgi:3',5'-cyclic AMP phosphodiesterase CpdA